MLEANSGPLLTEQQVTHDLRSYQYVAFRSNDADLTPTEWGVVNYSEANLDYLISLFKSEPVDPNFVGPPEQRFFSYYNFTLQDFLPQRLNAFDIKELQNNYTLNFTYNYYDANYESLSSGVPEPYLPNHYVLRQQIEVSQAEYGGQANSLIDPVLYGDDINEEAADSLSTLSGRLNPYQYYANSYTGGSLTSQGFNFAYNPNNYYYNHHLNFEAYSQTNDYFDFRDKTRNCFMSFNRRVDDSSAPFYSKLRINFRSVPNNRTTNDLSTNQLIGNQHKVRPYMFYLYSHFHNSPFRETTLGAISRSYRVGTNTGVSLENLTTQVDAGDLSIKLFSPLFDDILSEATGSFLGPDEITLFEKVEYTDDNLFNDRAHFLDTVFPDINTAENRVKQFLSQGFNWNVWKPGLGKFIGGVPDYEPIIVCFKIEKFSTESSIPIQTFYIDHDAKLGGTNGESFVEFLDTQLKYGGKYRYRVSAFCRLDVPVVKIIDMFYSDSDKNLYSVFLSSQPTNLAVAGGDLTLETPEVTDFISNYLGYAFDPTAPQVSGYSTIIYGPQAQATGPALQNQIIGSGPMTEVDNNPIEVNKIYIKTEIETRAQFMEIQLFEDSITALEPIFTPPDVKFYNQNGKPNDLLVRAQLNYNSLRDVYIPITPEDSSSITDYLEYFYPDNTYDFRTINGEGNFELRRLSTPPKQYSDFAQGYVQTFTAPQPADAIYSIIAYAINKVKPNKKYYYTLRTINNHGIYSNPTSVFEIELLQDSDDTFIIVEEYQFKNNLTNNYSKSGRRYLQLKVSNLQGLINEDSDEFLNAASADEISNVSLGPSDLENKVWGKTFKIRLTSEKTGRKIDLNVSFKHTDEPN